MQFTEFVLSEAVHRLVQWWPIALAFVGLEVVAGPKLSSLSRLRGAVFRCLFFFGTALAVVSRAELRLAPVWTVPNMPSWAIVLAAFVVGDFAYYCCHRLQHSVPWLWRFHAVHHSVRELSVLNSAEHWTEGFVRGLFVFVPVSLMLPAASGPVAVALTTIGVTLEVMCHSALPANFGRRTRLVFNGPLAHRLHHSLRPEHWNCNFASILSVWDRMFGTWVEPVEGDLPETGLEDRGEPDSVWGWILARSAAPTHQHQTLRPTVTVRSG